MKSMRYFFSLSSIPAVKAFFSKLNLFVASLTPFSQKEDILENHQVAQREERLEELGARIEVLNEELEGPAENTEKSNLEDAIREDQGEKEEPRKEEESQKEEICSVNINSASLDELQKITGVGPVIAQGIIEARPFSSIPDLIKANGIGQTTLQKIIDQGCAFMETSSLDSLVTGGAGGSGIIISEVSGGDGGGSSGGESNNNSPPPFPVILISEMQISPIGERFIELYNQTNEEVNLTNWYIQRKTATSSSWNSFVTSTQFEGKLICAQCHFLIARDATLSPDILLSTLTLTEDNAIRLRSSKGETVDLLGWGQAQESETSPAPNPPSSNSIGRKWDEGAKNYQDTNNNSSDFEIQNPTPKMMN